MARPLPARLFQLSKSKAFRYLFLFCLLGLAIFLSASYLQKKNSFKPYFEQTEISFLSEATLQKTLGKAFRFSNSRNKHVAKTFAIYDGNFALLLAKQHTLLLLDSADKYLTFKYSPSCQTPKLLLGLKRLILICSQAQVFTETGKSPVLMYSMDINLYSLASKKNMRFKEISIAQETLDLSYSARKNIADAAALREYGVKGFNIKLSKDTLIAVTAKGHAQAYSLASKKRLINKDLKYLDIAFTANPKEILIIYQDVQVTNSKEFIIVRYNLKNKENLESQRLNIEDFHFFHMNEQEQIVSTKFDESQSAFIFRFDSLLEKSFLGLKKFSILAGYPQNLEFNGKELVGYYPESGGLRFYSWK